MNDQSGLLPGCSLPVSLCLLSGCLLPTVARRTSMDARAVMDTALDISHSHAGKRGLGTSGNSRNDTLGNGAPS